MARRSYFRFWFLAGGAVIHNFPPPFPDQGHRLFEVQNEKAAKILLKILEENGLCRDWAFDFGPTHQVVMCDKKTVIAWFDKKAGNQPKNAISLAVGDPRTSALEARFALWMAGYSASVSQPVKGAPLWVVNNNAMVGGSLVFRKPWWNMPTPKIRKE